MRLNQIRKLLRGAVNRAEEEPGVRQLVLVWRVLQKLDHLRVGGGFFVCVMVEADRAEQLAVGDHEPVGERKLRVDQLVSQHHVTELVREHHRQTRLVREDINQTAAEYNRVSDGERLQRRGQQHAAVNGCVENQAIGDRQIVHHRLEHFVDLAGWSEQRALLEPVQHVVLGFLFPFALAENRRHLLGALGGVTHAGLVDQNVGELLLLLRALRLVAPKPDLALDPRHPRELRVVAQVFVRVHVSRQPQAGSDIDAPAVDVK